MRHATRSGFLRAVPALAVAAILLTGCVYEPIERHPPVAGDDGPPRYAFGPAVVPGQHPDGFGSEPSLLATPEGALYFTSVLGSATARGDGLWRSDDGGTSWTYLGKADYPFGGGDSDLDVLPTGRLLLTGQWRPAAPPALPILGAPYVTGGESVFRSDDRGASWVPNPVAGYLPAADRNWLAASPTEPGVAYLVFNDLATGLMVGKTTDGGLTWLPPRTVGGTGTFAGAFGGPNGIAGDPIVDAEGRLFIPYGVAIGGSGSQRLFRSMDGGETFQELVVRATPEGQNAGAIFASVSLDAAGNLYYAWAETVDGGMRVLVSRSGDLGDTWGRPIQVTPGTVTAAFPWIVAGDEGRVAVGYYATSGSMMPDDAPANATWIPVVSFGRYEGERVVYTATAVTDHPNHQGPICTRGTSCAGNRTLGDFFELAMMPDGRVAIVFVDDSGAERVNRVAVQTKGPSLLGPR